MNLFSLTTGGRRYFHSGDLLALDGHDLSHLEIIAKNSFSFIFNHRNVPKKWYHYHGRQYGARAKKVATATKSNIWPLCFKVLF